MGLKPAKKYYKLSGPVLKVVVPGMVVAVVVMNMPIDQLFRTLAALFFLGGVVTSIIFGPIFLVGTFVGTERRRNNNSSNRGPGVGGSVGSHQYQCEHCGKTLGGKGDVTRRSSFRCANCKSELNDQQRVRELNDWEW